MCWTSGTHKEPGEQGSHGPSYKAENPRIDHLRHQRRSGRVLRQGWVRVRVYGMEQRARVSLAPECEEHQGRCGVRM